MECCIYCGDWWQCRDHVIPVSYAQTYRYYAPGTTVKCCNECNTFLGCKAYHDIQRRAEYLKNAYIRNRQKDLNLPEWTQTELSRLGYNLRTSVGYRIARKEVYGMKLANLELVAQGFECKPIRYSRNDNGQLAIHKASVQCENCGSFFVPKSKVIRFCCHYCVGQNRIKTILLIEPSLTEDEVQSRLDCRRCLLCETRLLHKSKNAFFCSDKCSGKVSAFKRIGVLNEKQSEVA